jgi:hypothetical protein
VLRVASVGEADDVDDVDLDALAGRRDAEKLSPMRTAEGLPRRDFVVLGDLVVDLHRQIWERRAKNALEGQEHPLGARRRARGRRSVDEVTRHEIVKRHFISLFDDLFVEAHNDRFVGSARLFFGRHGELAPLVDDASRRRCTGAFAPDRIKEASRKPAPRIA